jgi:hypothetical protein
MPPPKKPRRIYTSLVEILMSYDRSIAAAQEQLVANKSEDDDAMRKASRIIEVLKQGRRSIEDIMRRYEAGER